MDIIFGMEVGLTQMSESPNVRSPRGALCGPHREVHVIWYGSPKEAQGPTSLVHQHGESVHTSHT